MADTIDLVAEQVRTALAADDPTPFVELLDPDVTWGAPGDPNPPCRNRNQVMAWYQRGRQAGVRGSVLDVEVLGGRLLVSMTVRNAGNVGEGDEEELRFQVLTLRNGRIAEIVGFDDKSEALTYVGEP